METTLHPFHRHFLSICQPSVSIKIRLIHKHGADDCRGGDGSDFAMKNFKFPPNTATHLSNRLHSSRFSRFFCVNNKVTPSIMSDQGNIPSGSKSESCSSTTATRDTVGKEKEKTDERRPIPEPPEKPLPGDCCGSGCVRCVWDIYYEELEEYNNLLKSVTASDSSSNLKPSV